MDLSRESYKTEKEFVKSTASAFGISTKGPRGAVILYSFFTFKQVDFNSYKSLDEFNVKVDSSPRLGRTVRPRRIDRALEEAARLLLQSGRSGPKVVILLTGGRQSQEPGVKSLDEAMSSVRSTGAKIYVVAFGGNTNNRELGTLTQHPQDVMTVSSFRDLLRHARPVAYRVKGTQGKSVHLVVSTRTTPSYGLI